MKSPTAQSIIKIILLLTSFAAACTAYSASSINISNIPLGTAIGSSIKPNLLFVLDESGSMAQDYTPDWVNDPICQADMGSLGYDTYNCQLGDVYYNSSSVNSQFYNPTIQYSPPKNADGTDWANASTSATKTDPFLSTSTKNITTTYTNLYWCKNWNDTPPSSNCVQNTSFPSTGYSYPNSTYSNAISKDNGNPYYYSLSSKPNWCSDTALTTCQTTRTSTFKYPSVTSTSAVTGVAAATTFYVRTAGTGTVTVTLAGNTIATLSGLTYNNNKSNRNDLANKLILAINNGGQLYASLLAADTGGSTCSTSTPTCARIQVANTQSPATSTTNATFNKQLFNITGTTTSGSASTFSTGSTTKLTGGINYSPATTGVAISRVDIVSATASYPKATGRKDCTTNTTTCTYAEELQNFANWYSYYRTRILMMKTAMSRSFSALSDTGPGVGFRVGLTFISSGASSSEISSVGATSCWTNNKSKRLAIGDFNSTQKSSFYTNLFGVKTCTYTPLRGALARAGQVYAGTAYVISSADPDPVQYSCQQNFTFMSTDGYWNSDIEDSTYGPLTLDSSANVGDQDGSDSGVYVDALQKSNTLADVAAYYYKTDLRPAMKDDVPTSTKDSNNKQHMVTFTMGLGVDGLLHYSPDYETGGSADYTAIGQGTKNWGDPIGNSTDSRIDDLWHAAVNGHGLYFSAANPNDVSNSLDAAIKQITTAAGAGAAAATSNLEPVAGDNYAYVASYNPDTWYGDLQAKTINLSTGEIDTTDNTSIWAAQGLLDAQTTRTLYTFNSTATTSDKKIALTWTNAQSLNWDKTGTDYFNPVQLSQCVPLTNCPGATKANLFAYLMGGADSTTNKSYRTRLHVLGDVVNSQPVYVKQPSFTYADSGYGTYKATTRKSMVYVGANDGFLHAFDASNGNEDWAYLPTAVVPSLYNLADSAYNHRYFVDGTITVGDIYTSSAWKTILVSGLNSGGSSFFALDITDPTAPKAVWEFSDSQMGKSFGNPIITKLPSGSKNASGTDISGKWVVLLTSGYNNSTGIGILYVLDAYTGAEQFRIYTCTSQTGPTGCSGTSSSPSGLAKINSWVDNPVTDNTSTYAYGGDLDGNVWRFDLKGKTAFNVAAVHEPITVKPELALVNGNKVVYFGTGIFLQAADRSDTTKRSIYGIKDDFTATAALDLAITPTALVQQTMALISGSTTTRTIPTPATVDWASKSGWYVTLLENGERVNVDPKIQLGTLVVASNVPDVTSSNTCTPGGHAWLNYLDIKSGSFIDNSQSNSANIVSQRVGSALAVGVNVIKLSNGKVIAITTTADNKHPVSEAPVGTANLPMKRVSWRELLTD